MLDSLQPITSMPPFPLSNNSCTPSRFNHRHPPESEYPSMTSWVLSCTVARCWRYHSLS